MLMPWGAIRSVAAKVFVKADGAVRRGTASSTATVVGLNGVGNQATSAGGDRGRKVAPAVPGMAESADCDMDPAVDTVKEQISIFTVLKIATILSAVYVAANPWFDTHRHYDREGFMCPRLVVCAPTLFEMILLTGSRFTAGLIYPGLVISIFSKCYATRSFLHHSWFGAVIDLEPSHDIHTYFGYITLVASLVHSILHAARYIYANMAYIMHETDAGRSGLIACALMLPIVLPMKFDYFRTKVRKNLHMLFLPMLVALCFHSVVFRYVGSILIVWYLLDRVFFTTIQTFLIDHPIFKAVGRGTMVTLDLPPGYTFKAGSYIYVNSPMISRSEWHPFSIIQVPGSTPRATFYAEAVGDWTQDLFRLGLEQDRLPLWITAAQPSLMEKSIYYDNVVLVCTGAGITPAVSIIERYDKKKNIHLLWMSRDGGMVALFEKQLRQVRSTVHLTGKPTETTKGALQSLLGPLDIHVVEANARRSFRSSTTPMPKRAVHDASEVLSITSDDFDELDTPPPSQLMPLGMFGPEGSLQTERHHRLDIVITKPHATANVKKTERPHHPDIVKPKTPAKAIQANARVKTEDPVKLVFGRPNIGDYLVETFATQAEVPGTGDEGSVHAVATHRANASILEGDIERGAGLPERPRSDRLDTGQKVSKQRLLKADETVLTPTQHQRTKSDKSKGDASSTSRECPNHGRPLRWLVLYCGANPQVEEAIAKTCDDLRVNWQKEYFGAW